VRWKKDGARSIHRSIDKVSSSNSSDSFKFDGQDRVRSNRSSRRAREKVCVGPSSGSLQFYAHDLFYPIYSGWTTSECPFFKYPSEALCWQMSHYMKDGICQLQSLSSLQWMRCIGKVCSTQSSHFTKKYCCSSDCQSAYYSNVTFQYLQPNCKIGTIILISHLSLFEQCKSTFHSHCDYQSSSISTYLPNSVCVQQNKSFSKLSQSDQKGMRLQRDSDNLISIGQVCKTFMKNNSDYDLGKDLFFAICSIDLNDTHIFLFSIFILDIIIKGVKHIISLRNDKTLIVFMCCGTASSEFNSTSPSAILCLDTNRRSLFAARMSLLQLEHPSSMFVSFFDYTSDIETLFSRLKMESGASTIRILYQHPTPSVVARNSFSLSCCKSVSALIAMHIDSIHFVFDHYPERNSWTPSSLRTAFSKQLVPLSLNSISISKTETLCCFNGEKVHHPLFGKISRYGWAKMKNGEELSIRIVRKLN
jgi:hypothetical protein